MKLPSILLGLSVAITTTLAHPLDLPFQLTQDHYDKLYQRQTSNITLTTGVAGATYPRYEIRELQSKKPNQWTLFILAMQQFQAQAQTSVTSYYQIAGIHGVPRVDYNGVGQCSACSGTDGYCTHNSVLFPAWHRTYMALFEQEFMTVVNSIANSWPVTGGPTSRAQMTGAAATMRFPYWDWAATPPSGGNNLPASVSSSTITVYGPTGEETISNPLFRHVFADSSDLYYYPFTEWNLTYRYPSKEAVGAVSEEATCVADLNAIRTSLQDQIYQLFTTCDEYLYFSNADAGSSSASCSNSLEGIHNTVHQVTGGGPTSTVGIGGHMYYLSLAAFDPVFWLHHCNVDRFFAMWQTLHPDSYGASQVAPQDTWTIAAGSTQDQSSPLTPFLKDASGDFWTTTEVQDWESVFHYTYPEFVDSNGSQSAIASYVNALYGPSATATAGSSKRTAAPDPNPVAAAQESTTTAASTTTTVSPTLTPLIANNGSLFQYVANIQSPRYSSIGSYTIYLFMGAPTSEEPSTWLTDPNLIGPMSVLAQDGMQMQNINVTGSIPLTRSLTAQVNGNVIADLTEDVVGPYLQQQLQWRISGAKGAALTPAALPGFKLSVFASTATRPDSPFVLPVWSDFIPMEDITQGREGGANGTATTSIEVTSAATSLAKSLASTGSAVTVSVTVCPSSLATCTTTAQ